MKKILWDCAELYRNTKAMMAKQLELPPHLRQVWENDKRNK
jgi:hypothetical protein